MVIGDRREAKLIDVFGEVVVEQAAAISSQGRALECHASISVLSVSDNAELRPLLIQIDEILKDRVPIESRAEDLAVLLKDLRIKDQTAYEGALGMVKDVSVGVLANLWFTNLMALLA